ncbi:hypothetical protein M3Y99_00311200 [Aphelenchoides fujianensis]|nr:hypothetical protein M3Y99_00311200 [Aphelenchoides fujianensis]
MIRHWPTISRGLQQFDRFLLSNIKGNEKLTLVIVFLIDAFFGFPFYGTLVRIAFGPTTIALLGLFVILFLFVRLGLFQLQNVDLSKLYKRWSKDAGRPVNFSDLNRSYQHSDLSLSLRLADQLQRVELENQIVTFAENMFPRTSPYTKMVYTEGQFNSFQFCDENADLDATADDLSTSSRFGRSFGSSKNQSSSFQMSGKEWSDGNKSDADGQSKDGLSGKRIVDEDPILAHLFSPQTTAFYSSASSTAAGGSPGKGSSDSPSKSKGDVKRARGFPFSLIGARQHRITINDAFYTDLMRYSMNLRLFVNKNVIKPLIVAMEDVNRALVRSHANFSVGNSSVELLQMAMEQKPELRQTKIPFLIPYLRVHTNQAYLVHRIRELAQDPGITEHHEELKDQPFYTPSSKKSADAWNTPALSDSELIFKLFGAYLDLSMAKRCLVNHPDKPFSSIYTLKEPEEPSVVQSLPNAFYIYVRAKEGSSSW